MTVESIRTTVEEGDMAGDHLLVPAGQMALRKVDGVGEVHHLAQEIGARAEALDDSRHLRSPRTRPPVVVSGRGVSGGLAILGNSDLRGLILLTGARRRQNGPFLFLHDDRSYLVRSLEQKLQRHLDYTGTDVGVNLPEGRRTDVAIRKPQVRAIQEIEKLAAEL
jgi:hypothetical protein